MRARPPSITLAYRLAQNHANRRQDRDVQDGVELVGNSSAFQEQRDTTVAQVDHTVPSSVAVGENGMALVPASDTRSHLRCFGVRGSMPREFALAPAVASERRLWRRSLGFRGRRDDRWTNRLRRYWSFALQPAQRRRGFARSGRFQGNHARASRARHASVDRAACPRGSSTRFSSRRPADARPRRNPASRQYPVSADECRFHIACGRGGRA